MVIYSPRVGIATSAVIMGSVVNKIFTTDGERWVRLELIRVHPVMDGPIANVRISSHALISTPDIRICAGDGAVPGMAPFENKLMISM